MTDRVFPDVQRDLEKTVAQLHTTRDPDDRRDLLRKMKSLLQEADDLSGQTESGHVSTPSSQRRQS